MKMLRPPRGTAAALAIAAIAFHGVAHADLWAYVDSDGRSHVANRQVDSRYTLFFKGETSLDAPQDPAVEREQAVRALSGTRLYERATDERLTRRYAPLIDQHARSNGLDPALVKAVVAVESAFDPQALSDKGAVGLMQVIPDTGERYGLTGDARRSVAQRLLDPATNLRIGTRYLRDLLDRFENSVPLALAAYNAGEGRVAARDNTVPPFAETRTFVRLVQQVYAVYRPVPAARRAQVTLPGLKRGAAAQPRRADGRSAEAIGPADQPPPKVTR
jgi:soluble lytic murein transglycosylase-like protein